MDDERVEVLAGLSMRDPDTGQMHRTYDVPGIEGGWTEEQRRLFDEVAATTVAKLRRLLRGLSADWMRPDGG